MLPLCTPLRVPPLTEQSALPPSALQPRARGHTTGIIPDLCWLVSWAPLLMAWVQMHLWL